MSDAVNDFFRQFYPPDWATNWAPSGYTPLMREYQGDKSKYPTVFPQMVCADGLALSVQGHWGAYSQPRDDFADRYDAVEIMGPKEADELLAPYEFDHNEVGDAMIYLYVPVVVVAAVIAKHGGLKPHVEEAEIGT